MVKEIYYSGSIAVDASLRRFWRAGQPVSVTPKVLDTLIFFLRNPDRAVSRTELIAEVWQGQMVSEANLNQHVSMLRKALGEGGENGRFLLTLPGRGYQWVAPVTRDTEPTAEPPAKPIRTGWLLPAGIGLVIVAAAATWILARKTSSTPAIGQRLPFTRLAGSEYQPRISRDGTKVAFLWDREGRGVPSVYVKGLTDDGPRKVSLSELEEGSPAWSPDGRRLAYVRSETSGLKLLIRGDSGGEERVLTSLYPTRYGLLSHHLDWSPDGLSIVVTDKAKQEEPFRLFSVDVATGERKPLTEPAPTIIGDADPRFSPDGSTISFVRKWNPIRHSLCTMAASGGPVQFWTDSLKAIHGQDWSIDGKRLLFSANHRGEYAIWSLDAPRTPPRTTAVSGPFPLQFSISRGGGALVYSAFAHDLNIWRFDLKPDSSEGQRWARIVASTAEDSLPELSPDGKRLCYLSDRSGEAQLWISNADGSQETQLTRGTIRPANCHWSPDSREVTFHDGATRRLYVVPAGGGTPQPAGGETVTGLQPIFRLDGRALLFSRLPKSPDLGVYQVERESGVVSTLIPEIPARHKTYSRDGRSIFFTRVGNDTTIWRYDGSGGVSSVLDTLMPDHRNSWAVGTHGIYYMSEDKNSPPGGAIRYHSFARTSDIRIAAFPAPLPPIGTAAWSLSPDERYLYCVRVDVPPSDLILVESFR